VKSVAGGGHLAAKKQIYIMEGEGGMEGAEYPLTKKVEADSVIN